MYKLAVDAMGGDFGPEVTVPACVDFLASDPNASILLVGDFEKVRVVLNNCRSGEKKKALLNKYATPMWGD